MYAYTKKHYQVIEAELKKILDGETFDNCLKDDELVMLLRGRGVYVTDTMLKKVRSVKNIPCYSERRINLFAAKGQKQ